MLEQLKTDLTDIIVERRDHEAADGGEGVGAGEVGSVLTGGGVATVNKTAAHSKPAEYKEMKVIKV